MSSEVIFQLSPWFIEDSLDHSRCFFANKLFIFLSRADCSMLHEKPAHTETNARFPSLASPSWLV